MIRHARAVKRSWPAICLGALLSLSRLAAAADAPDSATAPGAGAAASASPTTLMPTIPGISPAAFSNVEKRAMLLTQLLAILPTDPHWNHWLQSTGELPPDYDALPTNADLPDPLVIEENGKQVPITTKAQWERKRKEIRAQLEYWVTGRMPPAPGNVVAKVLNEMKDGEVTIRDIELTFGPDHKAKMNIQLRIPGGPGPFPVFITGFGKRSWSQMALRRGYMACLTATGDDLDDTELYAPLYPDYDWSCLARRAWGVGRVIDYLTTLPQVDAGKLVFSDHSRGGKMTTWLAAFDERLAAAIGSSPVTGGAIPWRYCADKFANETIEMITRNYPHWFHPRLRFFIGRENKLPVDMHEMVALVAPRAYMVTLGINESEVNVWGEERGYLAAKKVFDFLGAGDKIGIRFRPGTHRTEGSNVEEYFDWYDTVLGIRKFPPFNKLLYNYSFAKWQELSKETIDPMKFPEAPAPALGAPADGLLKTAAGQPITTADQWKTQREELRKNLAWGLGDGPQHNKVRGSKRLSSTPPNGELDGSLGYADWILGRPDATADIDRTALGFSDDRYVLGQLYYPRNRTPGKKMPVVIWLHGYSYSRGYSDLAITPTTSSAYDKGTFPLGDQGYMGTDFRINTLVTQGYAVFVFDMIGFGSRIPEAERFYQRYPRWSLMGKMVDDVRGAVDLLSDNDNLDSSKIFVMGYSLGGTVALYSAAMDDRIAGVVSVCGFTPLRTQSSAPSTGPRPDTLHVFSDVNGLMPRLGFFVGNEKRVPWDWDQALALVAPRPMMIVAPRYDQDAIFSDVEAAVAKARNIYDMLEPEEKTASTYNPDWSGIWRGGVQRQVNLRKFEFFTPFEFAFFTNPTQANVYYWMRVRLGGFPPVVPTTATTKPAPPEREVPSDTMGPRIPTRG